MSESVVFQRRDFLKMLGLGVAGAATGCGTRPADRLIPYLVAPNDVLPGVPYWYATTCRECSAGCGVLAKQREGRVIKLEGNPNHPVNRGGLCARGHAALQALYDPDRLKSPMVKEGSGWKAITWAEAMTLAGGKLTAARGRGALVTGNITGSLHKLSSEWATAVGASHLVYEPFAHESLREANRRTFGVASVPQTDFSRARFVLSLGADFLETWGAPVSQMRGFTQKRSEDRTASFVAVEPRLSMTAANADEWVAIRPGTEMAFALGLARLILSEGLATAAGAGGLLELVSAYTPEAVEQQTDVPVDTLRRIARAFGTRRPSLAVAGGIAAQSEQSVALLAAVNLLNHLVGNVGETVRFDRALNYDAVGSFADVQRLIGAMGEGQVGALVVHGANPVYAVPAWAGFAAAMDKVPFKVALATALDETAERCDLVLPVSHSLETFGDAQTTPGVYSLTQPAMRPLPMFDSRPAGDALIGLAQAAGAMSFPANWKDYLLAEWRTLHGRFGAGRDWDTFWADSLKAGGVFQETPVTSTDARWSGAPVFAAAELKGNGDYALVVYPTIALHDGRGANKTWLQELPDQATKVVWGSWAEIHPETAAKLGVQMGDPVRVETDAGSVEVPAFVYPGIRKDTVAIPLGQGHTAYGRFATGRGVNALALLPPAQDQASGAVAYLSARARLSKGTKAEFLARTQRNFDQHDRRIAQIIPVSALLAASAATQAPPAQEHGTPGHGAGPAGGQETHAQAHGAAEKGHSMMHRPEQTKPGKHTEPRAHAPNEKIPAHSISAFQSHEVVRSPRRIPVSEGMYGNAKHRWAMAIDLDRCTGCSACVVACNAENNIPAVGPKMIQRGREMHWLRIERFDGEEGKARTAHGPDVRFVPMLCQHCTDAPCEIVCPVYATYHNPEGLNAQVYNRCVGTRYCSNNCPYKVRAFNFFDYGAPEKETFAFHEPLNWQLNPDVTVRSKGVMEKCTFCVQRILEGKGNAKDEERPLRDGEIKTACQQSCPTEAIVFGDLMDPNARVTQLSKNDERRYWVLEELNTKPGITYLKKIERESA
ncbi:MAG TPA: molybdopterin-dependent oxidoreductase [Candidatus Eisenbacteria bacterium]|nr:molybdopterin-dependent oxidoreductase [Candidatus Eisenbacteria bacterium]